MANGIIIIMVPHDEPIANDNIAATMKVNNGRKTGFKKSFASSPTYTPVPSSSLTVPSAQASTKVAIMGSIPDIPFTYSENTLAIFLLVK